MEQQVAVRQAILSINEKIRELVAKGVNVIGNEVYFDSDPPLGFKYAFEVVNINPDPKYKEVYPQKGGDFSLTGLGCKRMAKAMNVRMLPGKVMYHTDTSIAYRARAFVRGLDGQNIFSEKDYEFNLEVREDEFKNKWSDKVKEYQHPQYPAAQIPPDFRVCKSDKEINAWINEKSRIEMIQKRKNAPMCAQTGAQLRCIRDLGPIASTYSMQQLKQPFLIVKLVQHLDPSNAIDRQFALDQSRIPMAMFPTEESQATQPVLTSQGQSIAAQAPVGPVQLPSQEEHIQLEEMLPSVVDEEVPLVESELTPFETALMDFDACEVPEQLNAIKQLILDRQWQGRTTKAFEQFSPQELRAFFEMLIAISKPGQVSMPWAQ